MAKTFWKHFQYERAVQELNGIPAQEVRQAEDPSQFWQYRPKEHLGDSTWDLDCPAWCPVPIRVEAKSTVKHPGFALHTEWRETIAELSNVGYMDGNKELLLYTFEGADDPYLLSMNTILWRHIMALYKPLTTWDGELRECGVSRKRWAHHSTFREAEAKYGAPNVHILLITGEKHGRETLVTIRPELYWQLIAGPDKEAGNG